MDCGWIMLGNQELEMFVLRYRLGLDDLYLITNLGSIASVVNLKLFAPLDELGVSGMLFIALNRDDDGVFHLVRNHSARKYFSHFVYLVLSLYEQCLSLN